MDTQQSRMGGEPRSFAESLQDLQGDYVMLDELYAKQRSYGKELSEMMKTLQGEVNAVIQIRPEVLGNLAQLLTCCRKGLSLPLTRIGI